jgi:hypothetical protein
MLDEFGPHNSWSGSRAPTNKKKQFRDTLAKLASEFSEETGSAVTPEAVENQLDWGITIQKEMKDQSHVRNFILNKAAALEVNFITSSDLPELMSVKPTAKVVVPDYD